MRRLSGMVLGFAVLISSISITGCGSSPTLSDAGYQKAVALLNSCTRQDESALQRVDEAVAQAEERGEISAAEVKSLQSVIAIAKQGKWDAASSRARGLLEKQIQKKPPESRQRHRH